MRLGKFELLYFAKYFANNLTIGTAIDRSKGSFRQAMHNSVEYLKRVLPENVLLYGKYTCLRWKLGIKSGSKDDKLYQNMF